MKTTFLELEYTLQGLHEAVQQFWQQMQLKRVLAFSGEMSAGKTTFIHALCEWLQVEDVVSSPTFSLINEYHFTTAEGPATIYHMDWYRINSIEEAIAAGIEDCLLQSTRGKLVYCFIEWPERAMPLLPASAAWVRIETPDPAIRQMTVTAL